LVLFQLLSYCFTYQTAHQPEGSEHFDGSCFQYAAPASLKK
jgi:hypothetical protein